MSEAEGVRHLHAAIDKRIALRMPPGPSSRMQSGVVVVPGAQRASVRLDGESRPVTAIVPWLPGELAAGDVVDVESRSDGRKRIVSVRGRSSVTVPAPAEGEEGWRLTVGPDRTLVWQDAGGSGEHPDLSTHDAMGLATDAELSSHAANATAHGSFAAASHDHSGTYQPLDSELTAIAGLTSAADKVPYFTGSGAASLATFTTAGRNLVDDADASTMRTTLGLGTMATQAATAVAITGGTIDDADLGNVEIDSGVIYGTGLWPHTTGGLSHGTSFPGSPSAGDRCFRTDLGMEAYYDGTRWLSTQVYWAESIKGSANSATDTHHIPIVYPNVYDKWLISAHLSFLVQSGGSALSGSHKWVQTVLRGGTTGGSSAGDAISPAVSWSIDSGNSNEVRVATPVTIGALLGISRGWFRLELVKTGTPGNIFNFTTIAYRLVLT